MEHTELPPLTWHGMKLGQFEQEENMNYLEHS